jgi:hypothetical protein
MASGLQYTYSTYFGTQLPLAAGASGAPLSFDLIQAASMTKRVIYVVVPTPSAGPGYDHFVFPGTIWERYQHRLAAFYFPVAPVDITMTPGQSAEIYAQTVFNFDNGPRQYSQRQSGGTSADLTLFGSTWGPICQSLERSPVGLALSGTPTNNSLQLHLDATLNTIAAGGAVLYAFLETVRVANILGDNLVVDY